MEQTDTTAVSEPQNASKTLENLNDNQKKLYQAITEFLGSLTLNIWGENNHASKALKNVGQIIEKLDKKVLVAVLENYFNNCNAHVIKFSQIITREPIEPFREISELFGENEEIINKIALILIISLSFNIKLLKNCQIVGNIGKNPNITENSQNTNISDDFHDVKVMRNDKINNLKIICEITMEILKNKSTAIIPLFSAKLFTLISLIYDLLGKNESLTRFWFQMLSTHALTHHHESYATLINLILRSYTNNSQWSQAESFVSKCKISELASNPQQAKYSFYCGMINLIHCQYREALFKFSAAFTCSQNFVAIGFKQACIKFILLSKLLMGDYPDRKLFYNDCYFKGIIPYFDLIKAVKLGSTTLFTKYITENKEYYIRDRTTAIVMRLHHNVLQAALVKLSLSYSSIYLDDVAKKIQLQGPDIEFVVAKAIKDQIIRAEIDHEKRIVNFNSFDGYYQTFNSLEILQARAADCHQLYRKFMTSMKYPRSAYIFDGKNDNIDEFSDMEFLLSLNEDDLI